MREMRHKEQQNRRLCPVKNRQMIQQKQPFFFRFYHFCMWAVDSR